jgi:NADPH:quinone reductase-like Zn-dependent oxidoreductase/acyl carrier protein
MDDDGEVLVECESVSRSLPGPIEQDALASCAYQLEWQPVAAEAEEKAPATSDGRWLIVAEGSSFERELCRDLERREIAYTSTSVESADIVTAGAVPDGPSPAQVLFVATPSDGFSFEQATGQCARLTALVQKLAQRPDAEAVRLSIVTSGCQPVTPEDTVLDITASPLWGLGRVIRQEFPYFECVLIDVESGAAGQAPLLIEHLLSGSAEPEIALRGDQIHVARLRPAARANAEAEEPHTMSTGQPVILEIDVPGRLDTLRYHASERRAPEVGEVEIEVHAAALNFKDLLKAMGTISAEVLRDTYFGDAFGMECAGVVTRVGEGVTAFQPGDEVIASPNQGSFRSYVTTACEFVYPKPAGLRMEEAPNFTGFLTAYYSLVDVGRLRPGEKVLIHNATGGVGLAAVQIAQWIGAEIFSTAGTAEKRDYLRGLGVTHVMDSRTLLFADQVKQATRGRGVDVVLNAMAGEALMKSFSLLAPYGRFVEIGKQDIAENSGLPMSTFNRNVSFAAVDLDRMFQDRVPILSHLIRAVCAGFERGDFQAIPVRAFPASEAEQAFRYMAQSKHIGKVVISMYDQQVTVYPAVHAPAVVKPDGAYLVTGGTRGFGLEITKWLAARGARHLVLVSRTGELSPEARHVLMMLRGKGIQVLVRSVDVADQSQVAGLFAEVDQTMPALRGIIHGAMVLDDGLLAGLSPQRFERVMAPKVLGTWLLHEHSTSHPLDFFVMLSSISSLVGNVGQGNYAAANAFLDHFAHYRRALGLPAVTVNWGALGDVGVAARNPALEQMLAAAGIRSLPVAQAVAAIEGVLEQNPVQIGVFDVDWQKWAAVAPHLARLPIFQEVIADRAKSNGGLAFTPAMRLRCKLAVLEHQERQDYLQSILAEALAYVLQLPVSQISPENQIAQLGLDSLMTVELRTALQGKYGIEISTVGLLKGGTIGYLAGQILAKVEPELVSAEVAAWLSDERLNSLIEEELSAAQPVLAAEGDYQHACR